MQLSWRSTTILTVCNYLDSLQLTWQSEIVWISVNVWMGPQRLRPNLLLTPALLPQLLTKTKSCKPPGKLYMLAQMLEILIYGMDFLVLYLPMLLSRHKLLYPLTKRPRIAALPSDWKPATYTRLGGTRLAHKQNQSLTLWRRHDELLRSYKFFLALPTKSVVVLQLEIPDTSPKRV